MRLIWGGFGVTAGASVLLVQQTTLTWGSATWLSVLCVMLPVLAFAQMRGPLPDVAAMRVSVYASSGVSLLVLGGMSLVGMDGAFLSASGVDDGGWSVQHSAEGSPGTVGWTLIILVVGVVELWVFSRVRRLIGVSETTLVRDILPETVRERWAFAGLSCCAGFGEEAAYRGFAVPALIAATGSPVAAVLLTSGAFGALHLYQGWFGVVRTTVLGGILGWGFLASGSLLAPILAHAGIDLVAGLVLKDRLLD